MRVFEERLQEFDGVSEPDQERGTVVARMRHHIQDWRINYHSIMKQLSSEPNSRKNDANEPDQWESETVRVGTSIHRAGINFDGTELVSNLDEDGSQIEDDWIEAYMSP